MALSLKDDRVHGSLNGVGFRKQASFSFPYKFSPKTTKLIVKEKVKLISCLLLTNSFTVSMVILVMPISMEGHKIR